MALDIILTVLVATIPERNEMWQNLMSELNKQTSEYRGMVDVQSDSTIGWCNNIGKKRNNLLNRATGKYIVFIDDDDSIAPNYISLILEACKSNADCIGISGTILHEGITKQWHISKDYGHWFTKDNVFYRTPNHISPVKREIALKAMFPEIPHGEDAEYSRRILPFLQTETKITGNIYFYYPSH